jgi:hypothetical protein
MFIVLTCAVSAFSIPIAINSYSYSSGGGQPYSAYPDTGTKELTNGISPPAVLSDAGWVGFLNSSPVIVFDFGTVQAADVVKISYFYGYASVGAPASADISFSSDGVNYSTPVHFTGFTGGTTGGSATNTVYITVSGSGRYMKVISTKQYTWQMLGEICAESYPAYTYDASTKPDNSYLDSSSELLDGYYPVTQTGTPWGDAGWVGWLNKHAIIYFDLGTVKEVGSLQIYYFYGSGGIASPLAADISFSDDGVTYSNTIQHGAFLEPAGSYTALEVISTGNITARYVKVDVTPDGQWLFLGEIYFPNESRATLLNAVHKTMTIDGQISDWSTVPEQIELDTAGRGDLVCGLRFAWDTDYLYMLMQEKSGCTIQKEAYNVFVYGIDLPGMGPWNFQSVGFSMNFTNADSAENIQSFNPWFGFNSNSSNNLYIARLNNLNSLTILPIVNCKVASSGQFSNNSRVIEAALKWSDLVKCVRSYRQPDPNIISAIKAGFKFGCEPLLVDGDPNRQSYVGGSKNKIPNGHDENSCDVVLVEQ